MKKVFQVIGILIVLVPLIGFGLCGILGVGAGISQARFAYGNLILIVPGLAGIGISIAFGFVIRALIKKYEVRCS